MWCRNPFQDSLFPVPADSPVPQRSLRASSSDVRRCERVPRFAPADAPTRRGPTRGATLSSSVSRRRAASRRMRHLRRARIVQSASKEEESHRPFFRRGSSIAADGGDDPLSNRRELSRDDGTTRDATSFLRRFPGDVPRVDGCAIVDGVRGSSGRCRRRRTRPPRRRTPTVPSAGGSSIAASDDGPPPNRREFPRDDDLI